MKLISTLSKITLAALAGTALASPAALVPTPASEISTPVSTDPKVIPPVPATIVATEDGTCGIFKNGTTCEDTEHGACCSIAGFWYVYLASFFFLRKMRKREKII